MRVALDANPLFRPLTGVGTYVLHLVRALGQLPDGPEIVLPTVSLRTSGRAPNIPGTTGRHRRLPFGLVQALWDRGSFPPAEWVLGRDDLFHATNFVAPPLRRTPLVTTIHDLSFELYPDLADERVRRYREWVPDAVRRSRRLITPSAAMADDVAERYDLDRHLVAGIALGVDPVWSHAGSPEPAWREARGVPDRYLVFVGTPSDRKNIDLVLRAHEAARQVEGELVPPLVLAGPPPTGPVAARVGASRAVLTLGHLEGSALRRLVAGAAVLLYPSRYEGFGLPILEGLAAGTPVVASDIPAHREVAGGHVRLVDVEAGDDHERVDRLRSALVDALQHPLSADERAAGREWAGTFTWERTARSTVEVYEAALG